MVDRNLITNSSSIATLRNRKQLINTIVLDLDETLLSTVHDCLLLTRLGILTDPQYSDIRERCYILTFYDHRSRTESVYCGIARPHLTTFLNYINKNYHHIIYTAGDDEYAVSVPEQLFPQPPLHIFSNKDCLHHEGNFSKPLRRLFELKPELNRLTTLDQMLMVDDRWENLVHNVGQGYLIPEYTPQFTIEGLRKDDRELLKLIDLLEEHKSRQAVIGVKDE